MPVPASGIGKTERVCSRRASISSGAHPGWPWSPIVSMAARCRRSFQLQRATSSSEASAPAITIAPAPISGWQNQANNLDVNNDGKVAPLDALIIINRLNAGGGGPLPQPSSPPPFSAAVSWSVIPFAPASAEVHAEIKAGPAEAARGLLVDGRILH